MGLVSCIGGMIICAIIAKIDHEDTIINRYWEYREAERYPYWSRKYDTWLPLIGRGSDQCQYPKACNCCDECEAYTNSPFFSEA